MSIPANSTQDVKRAFLDSARADAALTALLKGTVGDPRIYWFFQAQAAGILDSGGAYIHYSLLNAPELRGGTGEPVFKFTIWSRDQETVESVRDRLFALWDKQKLTTGNGRILFGKCVHENDEFQEHDNFAGKTVHFRFGWFAN